MSHCSHCTSAEEHDARMTRWRCKFAEHPVIDHLRWGEYINKESVVPMTPESDLPDTEFILDRCMKRLEEYRDNCIGDDCLGVPELVEYVMWQIVCLARESFEEWKWV